MLTDQDTKFVYRIAVLLLINKFSKNGSYCGPFYNRTCSQTTYTVAAGVITIYD